MPKVPKEFCIDDFIYKEYIGENNWSEPEYKPGTIIKNARIDRGSEYSSSSSGKQLLYHAVVFCYEGITTPIPTFKEQSLLVFDGKDHVITKVIPIYEAYSNKLYSYELEVV